MDNQAPQDLGINDIITPVGVDAWPPAPGWWLLGLLLISLIMAGYFFYTNHQKKWAYRRTALKQLQASLHQFHEDQDAQHFATELMSTLKRVSLTAYGPHSSTLNGESFLRFSNSVVDKDVFSEQSINGIEHALYTDQCALDVNAFYSECIKWIKTHPINAMDGDAANV